MEEAQDAKRKGKMKWRRPLRVGPKMRLMILKDIDKDGTDEKALAKVRKKYHLSRMQLFRTLSTEPKVGSRTTAEQAALIGEIHDQRERIKAKSWNALEDGVDWKYDPYKRALVAVKVLTGMGELTPEVLEMPLQITLSIGRVVEGRKVVEVPALAEAEEQGPEREAEESFLVEKQGGNTNEEIGAADNPVEPEAPEN